MTVSEIRSILSEVILSDFKMLGFDEKNDSFIDVLVQDDSGHVFIFRVFKDTGRAALLYNLT